MTLEAVDVRPTAVTIPSEAKLLEIENSIQPWKLHDLSKVCESSDVDALRLYMGEVRRQPLLSAQQELALSVRVEQGLKAREKMAAGWRAPSQRPPLSLVIEKGFAARQNLINYNTRLVFSIAKIYMERGLDYVDLVGYGNIGLIRGTGKYEFRKGWRFSTHVSRWIHAEIGRSVISYAKAVRYPEYMVRDRRHLFRKIDYLTQVNRKVLSIDEIAEDLDTDSVHIQRLIDSGYVPFSLDEPEDNSVDSLKCPSEINPCDYHENTMMQRVLAEALARLTPFDEKILRLRTGLMDGHAYSQRMVAKKLGISCLEVQHHETEAIGLIRGDPKYNELSEYLVQ